MTETKPIYRNYSSRLEVNREDESYFTRLSGISRFVYNWGQNRQSRILRLAGTAEDLVALDRLNALLREETQRSDREWLREAPWDVLSSALADLHRAYGLWQRQNPAKGNKGYLRQPAVKHRGSDDRSFTLDTITIQETPGAAGHRVLVVVDSNGHRYRLRRRDLFPPEGQRGRFINAVVKLHHGEWHIVLQFSQTLSHELPTGEVVGVDPGLKTMAVDSDGNLYDRARLTPRQQERLRFYRSRRNLGPREQARNEEKIRCLVRREHNLCENSQHQATNDILGRHREPELRPRTVVLDRLCLTEVYNSGASLARKVGQENLFQFFRKLKRKAEWQGSAVLEAGKWIPSSKTCGNCGHLLDTLTLDDRVFECPECGLVIDRDMNAAINLRDFGVYGGDWFRLVADRATSYKHSVSAPGRGIGDCQGTEGDEFIS